ncbi:MULTISPECIES: hypothetical protein [unclassified Pseudoclavibacter]|uniref:hypothetical protein n=1 Tax=unclassified Pseudoclavibacter TaxID=2615177 RepID=UPI001BAD1EEA|nr:hypothetical protein [Pseudoclavibacter sp. Marseille-Q4354]MBS3180070.1 hypothetical protein [Pseudoclavibacter sp. Marseille-Q4354]
MSTLIFTIAQNGYGVAYQDCIDSQRRYAARIGANYAAVTEPKQVAEIALSAWLKVPLILGALRAGYDYVAFIDADARVAEDAPDFRTETLQQESVGMALGRSGRVNSGVIFTKRDEASLAYFERIMASLEEEIPAEDRQNLKYENGNLIYVTKLLGGVETLDLKWNNTSDVDLKDHIRHYTGPLRDTYRRSLSANLKYRLARIGLRKATPQPAQRSASFVNKLQAEVQAAEERYPKLVAPQN